MSCFLHIIRDFFPLLTCSLSREYQSHANATNNGGDMTFRPIRVAGLENVLFRSDNIAGTVLSQN